MKIELLLALTVFVLLAGVVIAETQTGNVIVNVKYDDLNPVEGANVTLYNDPTKSLIIDSGRTNGSGQFVSNTQIECDRNYWLEVNMSHYPIYFGPDYVNASCMANANVIPLKGDLTGNCSVDILDLIIIGQAYGSTPGKPNWNSFADIKKDNVTNIFDLSIVGKNYGKGEGVLSTFYQDKDGDTYGNPDVYVQACVEQPSYVNNDTDCNDTDVNIHSRVTVYVEGGTTPYMVWIENATQIVAGPSGSLGNGDFTACLGDGSYLAYAEDSYGVKASKDFTEPGTTSVTITFR